MDMTESSARHTGIGQIINPDRPILNRASWTKTIVALVVTAVVAYRLIEWQPPTAGFTVSEFLSVILALFAIGLSVAFYLRADQSANQFYNNTYHFTKDVSEILGRMEAGFGERLRHIDEGYTRIGNSMGRPSGETSTIGQAIKQEDDTVRKVEKERDQLLKELTEKAKLQAEDRDRFFDQLHAMESELRQARSEASALRRQSVQEGPTGPTGPFSAPSRIHGRSPKLEDGERERNVTAYVQSHVKHLFQGAETVRELQERFLEIREALNGAFVRDLGFLGLVDPEGRLTDSGVRWLRRALRSPNAINPPS